VTASARAAATRRVSDLARALHGTQFPIDAEGLRSGPFGRIFDVTLEVAELCPGRADILVDGDLRFHITITADSAGDLPQKERLKRMPSQCGPMIGAIWVALMGVTVIMATP
jgi:hypothetical protein